MDKERIEGFSEAFEPGEILRWEIPKTEKKRTIFYEDKYQTLLEKKVTAVFAVSDFYALELRLCMQVLLVQLWYLHYLLQWQESILNCTMWMIT